MLPGYQLATMKPYVVPLYGSGNHGSDFIGTGTLIHYRDRYLMISCEHCFNKGGQHQLLVGSKESFNIDRVVLVSQPSEGGVINPVDFGVVALVLSEVLRIQEESMFMPGFTLEHNSVLDCIDDYSVFGFPAHDNRVNCAEPQLTANLIQIPLQKARKFHNDLTKKQPSCYLPLALEPRKIEELWKSEFKIPDPEGLSGGPIIRHLPRSRITMAGMVFMHYKHRKALLGLRSSAILSLLDHWWPRVNA